MAVKNSTILAKAWLEQTNDFQQRIPAPTVQDIASFTNAIFDPLNNDLYNQWSNGLINRIGMTIANNKRFTNPLAVFKRPYMAYGKSIQNIAIEWAKAHTYKDDATDLLKYERPEFAASYHTVNREDKYKVSVTRPEMRQAVAADGYGLNALLDMSISSCTNAEQYDEMHIMSDSIGVYDHYHPVFRVNIDKAGTKREQAQAILETVKTYVNRFRFPSTLYNCTEYQIPTFAAENECVLLVSPETMALIDVYAYAELFNVDRAEVRSRVVMLPELAIAGADFILTTQDIFISAYTEYGMWPFFDPNTLTTHNFLHAQGIYSINPFVPIVAGGTFDDVAVPTVKQTVTGIEVTPAAANAKAGDTVQLTVNLTGTIEPDTEGIEVKPDAVTWGIQSDAELNTRTYVDRYNVLHIQKGIDAGKTVTLTATAAWENPSGETQEFTKQAVITIE